MDIACLSSFFTLVLFKISKFRVLLELIVFFELVRVYDIYSMFVGSSAAAPSVPFSLCKSFRRLGGGSKGASTGSATVVSASCEKTGRASKGASAGAGTVVSASCEKTGIRKNRTNPFVKSPKVVRQRREVELGDGCNRLFG